MVKLSERLLAVTDLITPCDVVADVGCDHGYTSIYILQNKLAKRVIATDVNEGPLKKASQNVRIYECADKVDLRLSNGLEKYEPGEVQCIVISGMGGNLMVDILEKGKTVAESAGQIVLQPQSDIARVRHYLKDNGYNIISESFIKEDGKFYPMMKAVRGEMNWDREIFFIYGKILLREENPVLHEFLIYERDYYVNLYRDLACADNTQSVRNRLREVETALKYNDEALSMISEENRIALEQILN